MRLCYDVTVAGLHTFHLFLSNFFAKLRQIKHKYFIQVVGHMIREEHHENDYGCKAHITHFLTHIVYQFVCFIFFAEIVFKKHMNER